MIKLDANAHKEAFPVNQGISSDHLYEILKLLLEFQSESTIHGDILEVGVLSGATSAFLAMSLTENERLFLIDPYQDLESVSQSIASFARMSDDNIISICEASETVYQRRSLYIDSFLPRFRIVHIDGEHSYDAVLSDLHLAKEYLSDGGMIILDDIFNVATACCTHALFDGVRIIPTIHIVCIGLNKAFVCGSKHLGRYRSFFLSLPPRLAKESDLYLRVCLNDWSYERGYLSIHEIQKGEALFQMINHYSSDLQTLLASTHY